MTKKISGTLEWADGGTNVVKGCRHNCKYCYARYDALQRHHRVSSIEEWGEPVVQDHRVCKLTINWYTDDKKPKPGATIMFPTTHDITPECLEACIRAMLNVLDRGYNLLVVSKPHLDCIEALCEEFEGFKDRILFRFTIGAMHDGILKFWEPFAPNFSERFQCLQHAYHAGFKTSVSCEPMLDAPEITKLVKTLSPFCTDSIWIGKMNKADMRVIEEDKEVQEGLAWIEENQNDDRILAIYKKLKGNPLVKWKESIKEVVGLDLADEAGLDK